MKAFFGMWSMRKMLFGAHGIFCCSTTRGHWGKLACHHIVSRLSTSNNASMLVPVFVNPQCWLRPHVFCVSSNLSCLVSSCVQVEEHHAVDIDVYHCPNCDVERGPSLSESHLPLCTNMHFTQQTRSSILCLQCPASPAYHSATAPFTSHSPPPL